MTHRHRSRNQSHIKTSVTTGISGNLGGAQIGFAFSIPTVVSATTGIKMNIKRSGCKRLKGTRYSNVGNTGFR